MTCFHHTGSSRPCAFIVTSIIVTGVLCLSSCRTVPDHQIGKTSIVISLHDQQARLYKGKDVVASSMISTGREGHNTPVGQFSVIQKDADHRSSAYGYYADGSGNPVKENIDVRKDPLPPNAHFVGASMPFYLEFSPGYGLHKGYLPGFPASHGCVRMPAAKANQFYHAVKIGTPVTITP